MNEVKSKLPHIGTTIFSVMSKMAIDHDAINLSQGFPNFPVDPILEGILVEKAKEQVHQYAPLAGNNDLLEEIATLTQKQYGRVVSPSSEILVTAGATQAIFSIIQALVHTGDEVIILDPCYDCYESPVLLCGAHPIHIPLKEDFTPDWGRIEESITSKTRMLILNNPHNPSGKVMDLNDIEQLERLMVKHPSLLLLSDEVYEYITFEKPHISLNTREIIRERSILVSSFGKTFHITGWKVGYLIAPENLIKEIKKVHQFLVFCVNNPSQTALASYLKLTDVSTLGLFYQKKRDAFRALMGSSRFKLLPSEGSYFQVASFETISQENDVDFCKRLVIEHGVAAIPLSVFNANGHDRKLIRFCFAKNDETLTQAGERLCKI